MNIIITGVAGFIGSNLAKKLLELNHNVIGVDNLSYGTLDNMLDFDKDEKFKFIYGDLCNPSTLRNLEGDVLVHLASQKIPRYDNALRTLDENKIMLDSVMSKCLRDKIKLVYASTSDVYGKNPRIPFSEESDLVLGSSKIKRWAYAISKIHGEQYIIANSEQYNLNYSIARFFGSYGYNQNLTWWGGPQSGFISKAFKNEVIEIHGDGQQTRTFTFIDDTIMQLLFLVLNDKSNGEIFNIAGKPSEEISILNLAKIIWQMINDDEIKLKFIPYSNFGKYEDVMRRVPDISKIIKFSGITPQFTLKEGLEKTIKWQKNIINK
jgi:UDP-glucose 4-epimerase